MAKFRMLPLLLAGLLLSGCAFSEPLPPPEPVEIQLAPNEFRLASLPELEPFAAYSEISSRYYEEYRDHLLPAEDYGRLYPYAGKSIYSPEDYFLQAVYGLCDEQGRIVVDPVYSGFTIWEDAGVELISLYQYSDVPNREVFLYSGQWETMCVAAADGSWVTEEMMGYMLGMDASYFVTASSPEYYDEEDGYRIVEHSQTIYVYNTEGQLLRSIENVEPLGYFEGTLSFRDSQGNARVQDIAGNTILEGFEEISPFYGTYAIAKLDNDRYVLVDREGNYDPEKDYTWLYYNESNGYYDFIGGVLDENGEIIPESRGRRGNGGSVQVDDFTGHRIIDDHDNDDKSFTLRDLDSGESFTKSGGDSWMSYVGNGWCSWISQVDGELRMELYKLGDAESSPPRHSIPDGDSCFLLTEQVAVIPLSSEITETNEFGETSSYTTYTDVLFLDLESGEEIARVPGQLHWHLQDLGVLIDPNRDWNGGCLYNAKGERILDGKYHEAREAGEGRWAITGNTYTGLIDENGEWILRFCVNNLD